MNKLHKVDDNHVVFYCPACECGHMIRVGGDEPVWGWNDDIEFPTFTPSIFVNRGSVNPTAPACHSFVAKGTIQFLGDCTHDMAGQTVEIPEWDE